MKMRIYIFLTLSLFLTVHFSGCGDSTAPRRITEAFGEKFGILNSKKREIPAKSFRWQKISGDVEIFCTPHTGTVWRVDFVTTEASPEKIHQAIFRQWHCKIDETGVMILPQSTVKAVPEYRRGPSGMRISVIDHPGRAKNEKEKVLPEVISAEQRRQASETIFIIEEALEHFFTDTGNYPRLLTELTENLLQRQKWDGPYIDLIPPDPWNNPYHYRCAPDGRSYEFFSRGKNGRDKIR